MYEWQDVEQRVQQHWQQQNIPQKIAEFNRNSNRPKFYLLDGPPYPNATPHAGHALTITYKDIWGKYKYMDGYEVWWQPGFDCHGLPIENKVEKEINIQSKKDIERYGVTNFIERCKEFSTQNMEQWMHFYRQIAAWKGWLDPYLTYNDSYIESGWWTMQQLYRQGSLVEGEKPIHWCPHCETSLSGYEVSDSYKTVQDPSIYMKFPVRDRDRTYLVAWTTTPWTLPANIALIVHPDETYVTLSIDNEGEAEHLIMAKALVDEVMKQAGYSYNIVDECSGSDLAGLTYEPLLETPLQHEVHKQQGSHQVYVSVPILKQKAAAKVAEKKGEEAEEQFDHIVTMSAGTGIVHCAPGHGEEDNKIGEHYQLPVLSPVDEEGKLEEGTGFTGQFVKDADRAIVQKVEESGRLLHHEMVSHPYPLCWRCKSPLVYRLSNQWFLSIDPIKDNLFQATEEINWLPEFAKERMQNWLQDSTDWCVSIQRYWGIPFPIWRCESCKSVTVVGSKAELKEQMTNDIALDDLHKHVVDSVTLACDCGSTMYRIPDLTNIWVESGIAPWASLGYPQHDNGIFNDLWTVDLVNESQDQVRGWFYAMLFMGMITFNHTAYKTCCLNGWMLDAYGEKMSKSLGNMVYAEDAYKELGADVLRLYYCHDVAPWETRKFSIEHAKQSLYRIMNTMNNISQFIEMYDIHYVEDAVVEQIENQWIRSRLNTIIQTVRDELDQFHFHQAGKILTDFILNDFSRLYLKLIKDQTDRAEVQYTIHEVFHTYLQLLAPITPFITEDLYQRHYATFDEKDSIHMCHYPNTDRQQIDVQLESHMQLADEIVETINALRQENQVKLRWPLQEARVSGSEAVEGAIGQLHSIITHLTNVKHVTHDPTLQTTTTVKPVYKELGAVFRDDTEQVVSLLQQQDVGELQKELKNGTTTIDGYTISSEMVQFEEYIANLPEGYAGKAFDNGVILLQVEQDQKLEEESIIRELVRQIQVTRKELGFRLDDAVHLYVTNSPLVKRWHNYLTDNVVTHAVTYTDDALSQSVTAKDTTIQFGIEK